MPINRNIEIIFLISFLPIYVFLALSDMEPFKRNRIRSNALFLTLVSIYIFHMYKNTDRHR